MLKVKVIAMGKCKEEWLRIALSEYEKRLSHVLEIAWIQPKDDAHLTQLLSEEQHYIALDPRGDQMESVEFSQRLHKFFEKNRARATFAIAGPNGFPPHFLQRSAIRWSLSLLTFTHQLTRLVLIEQIYRAIEIAKNSPYHK